VTSVRACASIIDGEPIARRRAAKIEQSRSTISLHERQAAGSLVISEAPEVRNPKRP